LQARKKWDDLFKVPKEKYYQPRIIFVLQNCPSKMGKIMTFTDKS